MSLDKRLAVNKKVKKYYIVIICMLAVFTVLAAGMQKRDLHLDETYSYGLSNTTKSFTINPPVLQWMDDMEKVFTDYLTVQEGEQFDYASVWRFQSLDVHPPFYYMLLHTICSFFPDSFSIYYALGLNLLFFLLLIVFVHKLVVLLTGSAAAASVTGLFFALSPAMLEANTFFRMYVMAMFWVVLFVCYLVRFPTKNQNIFFYPVLLCITVCGTLTHYYFLIFLFFFSFFHCLRRLCQKQYKEVLRYMGTMAAAGAFSILIFPAMPKHIFSGQRGNQSFDNLASTANYGIRIGEVIDMIVPRLFGGFVMAFLLAGVFLTIVYYYKEPADGKKINRTKKHSTDHKNWTVMHSNRLKAWLESESVILLLTVLAYIVTVGITAPYRSLRYYYPVLPLIMLLAALGIHKAVSLMSAKRYIAPLVGMSFLLLLWGQYKNCSWEYHYQDAAVPIAISEENAGTACLYIYSDLNMWKTQTAYYELRNYQNIMFVPAGRMGELKTAGLNEDRMVVYLQNDLDQEAMLQMVMDAGAFQKQEVLYEYHYDKVYSLQK